MKKLVPLLVLGCLGLGAAVHRLAGHDAGAPGAGGSAAAPRRPAPSPRGPPSVTPCGSRPRERSIPPPPAARCRRAFASRGGSAGEAQAHRRPEGGPRHQGLPGPPESVRRSGRQRPAGAAAGAGPGDRRDHGELDSPFLLRVDRACNITGFARLDSARVAAARTQQALAHELQWTMPPGASGHRGGLEQPGGVRGRVHPGARRRWRLRHPPHPPLHPAVEPPGAAARRRRPADQQPPQDHLRRGTLVRGAGGRRVQPAAPVVAATTHTQVWRATTPAGRSRARRPTSSLHLGGPAAEADRRGRPAGRAGDQRAGARAAAQDHARPRPARTSTR